jgi:hypothetical protein
MTGSQGGLGLPPPMWLGYTAFLLLVAWAGIAMPSGAGDAREGLDVP